MMTLEQAEGTELEQAVMFWFDELTPEEQWQVIYREYLKAKREEEQ